MGPFPKSMKQSFRLRDGFWQVPEKRGDIMGKATHSTRYAVWGAVVLLLVAATFALAPQQAHAAWYDHVSPQADADAYTISASGDTSGVTDHDAIKKVMETANGKGMNWDHRDMAITINLVAGETYYIDDSLKLYNNITINATGAKVKQVTNGKGVFVNAKYTTSASASVGGYDRCKNITINGGTYITSGKPGAKTTSKNGWYTGYSAFLFMHGQNINISNCTIKNNYNGHYIEFAGVKNSTITNCKIYGSYTGDSTNEAIQIDTSYSKDNSPIGAPWDGTTCKNINISGCTIKCPKMKTGVGTNLTCSKRYSRITVTNCKIWAKTYSVAIYKTTKATITNNTFHKGILMKHYTSKRITDTGNTWLKK